MTCLWCSKPSDAQYHSPCWRQQQDAAARESSARMLQAHALVARIRAGENPPIPKELLDDYGKYFKGAREARKSGRGRDTGSV